MDELEPGIREELGRRYGPVPEIDWARLETRIRAGAAAPLAARARRRQRERVAAIAIRGGLAAALLLGAAAAFLPDDASADLPVVEEVGPIAASELLPADPLFVTDQAAFVAAVTEPSER
jgi:hypothetical protein